LRPRAVGPRIPSEGARNAGAVGRGLRLERLCLVAKIGDDIFGHALLSILRLVEKPRAFDEAKAGALIAACDYQTLDQMGIEHLLG
jgi:hypothetical protein